MDNRLKTAIPGPKGTAEFKRRVDSMPKGLSVKLKTIAAKAEGALIEDIDGNKLIDFASGIGVMNIGYGNAELIQAAKNQLDKIFHPQIYLFGCEATIEAAEAMNEIVPGDFPKQTLFCNCGSESVENAIKIARYVTKRSEIVCFTNAFHGRTYMTMALTSKVKPYKNGFGPLPGGVSRMESPYKYRMPDAVKEENFVEYYIGKAKQFFLEQMDPAEVAAIILEPVQGEGGFIVFPPEYVQWLRKFCDENGILLIADEIQSGFCRTGKMFASQYWGVYPDLVVSSKSIASGLPLGAVTGRKDIMDQVHVGGLGGTLNGNPVSCAVAKKAIEIFKRDNFAQKAIDIGNKTAKRIEAMKSKFSCIGDFRGIGAMQAIELVRNQKTKEPATSEVSAIVQECWANGLVVLDAGMRGNCIRFLMPLVITDAQLNEGMDILEAAIGKAFK